MSGGFLGVAGAGGAGAVVAVSDGAEDLQVPKTCASWPDAPLAVGCWLLGRAFGACQVGLGLPGRGMIFGLWG
jgi:hypothetical protein